MRVAVALLLSAILSSCAYKDLCYNHWEHSGKARLSITMDWSCLSERPTGMTVMFFPKDGGAPLRHVTNDVDSVVLNLPPGTYNVLAFNQTVEEYESISFHDMDSWDDMYVSIADGGKPGFSREPAELMTGTEEDFVVTPDMLNNPSPVPIELTPHSIAVLTVIKVPVSGVQYARAADGVISGMAKSFYLTRNCTGTGTTSFELTDWTLIESNSLQSPKPGIISKSFVSFGLPGVQYVTEQSGDAAADVSPSQNLTLYLDIPLIDMATTFSDTLDVSDSWSFPVDVYHMLIESEGIALPEVSGAGGGFDVSVDDWEEGNVENIEIK